MTQLADRRTGSALSWYGTRLYRNGRPHRLLAGSMHYFRVHPELWRDRLERLRALGLNTVDTYVAWNFHERTEGRVRFDEWRDVEQFIRIAGEVGLDVIVRPGPYICAEWSNGGLPSWLTARIPALRTSDAAYLNAVDRWFDELIPRLVPLQAAYGGPVVAVQVENEYGSFGTDRALGTHLRDGLRRRGIVELLTTADGTDPVMQRNGSVEGAMPTFTLGAGVDRARTTLDAVHGNLEVPLVVSEFWNGWFDHWGTEHHTRSPDSVAATLRDILHDGGSASLYMAHGGTNFGLWAGANHDGRILSTVTSYDYDAPVAEDGTLTPTFASVRDVLAPFHDRDLPPLPASPRFLAPRLVPLASAGGLLPTLRAGDRGPDAPLPADFEDLGLDDGLTHYAAVEHIDTGSTLFLERLRDRAHVFVDGRRLGVLERDGATSLVVADGGTRIEIVVELLGRINYGHLLGERKGLGPVRVDRRLVHGWEHRTLDLEASVPTGRAVGDGLWRADVSVDTPGDAWVAVHGAGTAFVWLGEQLLGRLRAQGPQRTLYAPAPLWRSGRNVLRVLDLEGSPDRIELRTEPDLGQRVEFIGS